MKKISTLLSIIIFIFLFSSQVFAADFFTTTAKTQVNVDETFDIYVNINSNGDIINSGEGNMSFPSDLLSIISINNTSSIFSMWPEKPVFSNQNGTLSFNGGLPNPGFSGSKGVVLRITFKAKKSGSAAISIASGSIYSNDGTGTDVLKSKRGITMTIVPSPVKKDEEDAKVLIKDEIIKPVEDKISNNKNLNLPPIPNISSKDLIDLNNWFTQKDISLEWDIPKGVNAVQYSVDSNEIATPNILKIPPLNNAKLINMANGVSNFHIRFRNSDGWGEILHKKIKVDVIDPEIISVEQYKNEQGLISLNVISNDIHSSVDKIIVTLNDKSLLEVKFGSDKISKLDLPLLKTGDNLIKVIVYDVAGNSFEKEVNVNYFNPKKPLINIDKKDIYIGQNEKVIVKSYPNTEIMFWIKNQDLNTEKVLLKTDASGVAVYDLSNIKSPGTKTVWVSLNNDCQDICVLSDQISVNIAEKKLVALKNVLLQNIKVNNNLLPWIISFILFILYITSLIKNKNNKNKSLIQELNKAEIDVYKIFKVLKTDAKRYKTMLKRNKIDLIEKDRQIIENLEQDLDEAETYFAKRIEKIENELEL